MGAKKVRRTRTKSRIRRARGIAQYVDRVAKEKLYSVEKAIKFAEDEVTTIGSDKSKALTLNALADLLDERKSTTVYDWKDWGFRDDAARLPRNSTAHR